MKKLRCRAFLVLAPPLVLLAAAAQAITVTRPVSVQGVTPDSVTIVWNTTESVSAVVDYGPTLDYGLSAESKVPSPSHAITLHNLAPGQTYYYRVRSSDMVLYAGSDYHFRTVPDKRTSRWRFLAFGDSGKGNATQLSLVPFMVQAQPDFLIHVGDVIYPAGAAEDFDPKYFVPYAPFVRNTPVWLSIGNHDDATAEAQPYLDAFYLPRSPAGNERYYSFNYGQAHFVALDSDHMLDPVQLDWLEQDLANATTTWKFVYLHHPPYSCGMHGSSTSIRHVVAPLFETYGVDVVFSGHDHDYQRSYPMLGEAVVDSAQSPDFKRPRGVIYIVTGGGAGVRPTSAGCPFTAAAISVTHFTRVDVDGLTLTLQAIDNQGRVIDTMRIDKSPPLATPPAGSEPATAAPRLLPSLPNPFNPTTLVRYELPAPAAVRLAIYDSAGRQVRLLALGEQGAGVHSIQWDGRDEEGRRTASGLYLVRLQAGDQDRTNKLVLAK